MRLGDWNIEEWRPNYYHLAFVGVLILGAILRFHELGQPYFWQTEIHTVWPAMHFLEGNGFSNPVGLSQPYLRAWMTSTLPVSLSFAALGYTEFAARLPTVIIGLSTIVVLYFLGKEVGGRKVGLLSSGMLAVDFWVVSWHKQARMYAHNQFLYVFTVWLLFKWYSSAKLDLRSKYLLLLIPTAFLGYHNHIAYLGVLPSFGIFLVLTLVFDLKGSKWKKKLLCDSFAKKRFLWSITGFLLGIGYLLVRGIPHWLTGYSPSWYVAERGFLYFLGFLDQTSNLLFLFGLGLALVLRKKSNWIVPVAFVVPFAVQSLVVFKEPRLILHIYPLYILVASVPLVYILNTIESFDLFSKFFSRRKDLVSVVLIFALIFCLYSPFQSLEIKDRNPHGFVEGSNHREPVKFIEENRNEEDLILSSAPSITGWYMGNMSEIDYDLNYLRNRNRSENFVDPKIGIRAVKDRAEMKRIIENNSGWVVADDNFYTDFKIKTGVRQVIIENSQKVKNETWNEVDLYRFS